MGTSNIKDQARELVDKLPENSTWDDLMHEIYVRQAGRTTDVEQLRTEFGLSK